MDEPWRRTEPLKRRPDTASAALVSARRKARLLQRQIANAVGVDARTVGRWEAGLTHPSRARWTRIVTYLADFLPDHAQALAAAAGVASPVPPPPVADLHAIEAAIFRAADQLDVSPRRVREALRALAQTSLAANATMADLARVVEEKSDATPARPS